MKRFSIDPFDIVDTLYATAMDAERYDDMLETWSTALGKSDEFAFEFENRFADHLSRANQLLEIETETASDFDGEARSARFALDRLNNIVSWNAGAASIFGLVHQGPISDLNLRASSSHRLEKAIQFTREGHPQFVVLSTTSGQNVLAELTTSTNDTDDEDLRVESRQFISSEEINTLLTGAFNLTPSEVDILSLVLNGKTPQEIATIRDRKLPTVRSQIKSLLEKTSTQSQVELIRMVIGLSSAISVFEDEPTASTIGKNATTISTNRNLLKVSENRFVAYSIRGASSGEAVLYFHDEFFGDELTPQFENLLTSTNIKLICIFRPGYGGTTPVPNKQRYENIVLSDTLAVLQELRIGHPIPALARGVGFFRATMLAQQAASVIRSIIGVRPALPWGDERNIANAPPYTRLVVRMSKNAPKSFEFIAKAGYRYFLRFGAKNFIEKYYLSASSDKEMIERRHDILGAMEAGAEYALKDGVNGTGTDLIATKADWQPAALSLNIPVHLVIGEDDPTSRLTRAQELKAANKNVEISIAPGTGHLGFYSHPELIADLIAASLEKIESLGAH